MSLKSSLGCFVVSLVLVGANATDIDTTREVRLSEIVGSTTGATSISTWLTSLTNGKWPDSEINYTTGCDAQQASWPAQEHWSRINTFAAAWHGGLRNAAQFAGSSSLRASISEAMDFWFQNDFKTPACLDSGGTTSCPCSTPGFWNQNWNSNVILIPTWVGQVCLLLGDSLTPSELSSCQTMTGRAYATFQTGINGVSAITGANTLDIASVGIDQGLLTSDISLLTDAYGRVHAELTFKQGLKADGILHDGSFGQHAGILYNGNYGKDYANDVLNLEIAAADTQFQANDVSKVAFSSLISANQWMIFRNTLTGVLHWDFSVLGRIISLPVADNQATANLKMNLTQLQILGNQWGSADISQAFQALSSNSTDANVGSLQGNRMFYANDYMVQRGNGYVTTLKMYSKRTQNTECTNSQNTFGFHLSDGTLYNYLQGDEYEDIFAAWDWNLIPGITVDYNSTPLICDTARKTGTQPFVGGVSDGTAGIAAMRYETPTTKTLNWRKTWFFLEDDVQFVMVARITSTLPVPVFSVLDQRKQNGNVFINGVASSSGNYTSAASLWHGGVGYTFNTSNPAVSLSVQTGSRTGSWQTIGTSAQPPQTVDIFAAWLNHIDTTVPISYAIYPATTLLSFQQKSQASQLRTIRNDGSISALLDAAHNAAMLVFWVDAGGSVVVPSSAGTFAPITVKSSANANVIFRMDTWSVTLSEPTQTLTVISLNFTLGSGVAPPGWGSAKAKSITVNLPSGGMAGSSVTQLLSS
ncbi:polysaccharide lyase family 8 protein [Infundibulicybe gibba]|nr:polysaccharide lyase family 8 protein [Infundibulicybe gibba]